MNCPIEIPQDIESGDIVVLSKNTPYHEKGDYIAVHVVRRSKGKCYIAHGTNYGDASRLKLHNKVTHLKG